MNIYSVINLDNLDDCFQDMAENLDGKSFNKEALQIIEMLLYRSRQLGVEKDLIKKIQKYE